MKKVTRPVIVLFLLITGVGLFTGCHTAHGFGEDIESTGEAIQRGTQ